MAARLAAISPKRVNIIAWALLLGALVALFLPMTINMARSSADYAIHAEIAEIWRTEGTTLPPPRPQYLYHVLLILAHDLLPGANFVVTSIFLGIVLYVLCGLVIYNLARTAFGERRKYTPLAATLITVCLLLVWPVALLFPLDGHLHMGYIGSNVHHNATYILLKPLALLMLAQAVRIFDGQRRSWPGIILAAVVSAACTLAKPNFTVTILPAVALGVAYRLYRRQSVDWRLLLFGFGLPVAVVLLGQWPLFAALKGGLDFAPLKVMGGRSDYLLPKLILSILFPVSVYLAYFKNARQDVWLNLSWLAFLYGLAYTYLLAEDIAASHGNLTQSGRITMFVLFVVSALFVIRQGWSTSQATPRDRRFTLVVLLFGLHLISGLYWYVSQLQFDWWSWR